jgi:hypothetical protein
MEIVPMLSNRKQQKFPRQLLKWILGLHLWAQNLCVPFDQEAIPAEIKWIRPACGQKAQKWPLCGRSY